MQMSKCQRQEILYLTSLSSFHQEVSVCRTVTPSAAMGIISPRDFVDVIIVRKYEDGAISSNGVQSFLFPFGVFLVPKKESLKIFYLL